MGNTWFLGSAVDPYQGTNEAIGFWLGPAKGGFDMHLPSCSDELIDWTDEATQILRLFLQKGVSRQFAKSRPDSKRKYLKLSIKPLVLASSTQECQHLPSLGLIERVRFFAENVVILVSGLDKPPFVMSLRVFIKLHKLLIRYLELLVVMKADSPRKTQHLCSICLEESSKPVVLECAHSLCAECHQRWVHRQLSCPFCRLNFDRNAINQNQWEMMEWQGKDAVEDIVRLEIEIGRIWDDVSSSRGDQELLQAYTPMERYIQLEDQNGLILVKENAS